MEDLAQAAERVASLMRLLTSTGGLRLKYRITAGAGAADPDGLERRDLYIECKGPDADLLLDNEGELLRALDLPPTGIAIAVNEQVVRRASFSSHTLADGDAVEIIRAVAGG